VILLVAPLAFVGRLASRWRPFGRRHPPR
jgi:hypothetical protein